MTGPDAECGELEHRNPRHSAGILTNALSRKELLRLLRNGRAGEAEDDLALMLYRAPGDLSLEGYMELTLESTLPRHFRWAFADAVVDLSPRGRVWSRLGGYSMEQLEERVRAKLVSPFDGKILVGRERGRPIAEGTVSHSPFVTGFTNPRTDPIYRVRWFVPAATLPEFVVRFNADPEALRWTVAC